MFGQHLPQYTIPQQVNTGPWLTSYTLPFLQRLPLDATFVLPACSLATPYEELARLGDFVLPPLFHEALDDELKRRLLEQIVRCFPLHRPHAPAENERRLRIVDLPHVQLPAVPSPRVLAFNVDTAVEEHGPHLPLSTDTIQSFGILNKLVDEFDGVQLGRPVEYGQLTWGLPFGFSIDLTAELLSEYVRRYADAVSQWLRPQALYVVDVHGSITHRQAIVEGLKQSCAEKWMFRWLHEPLAEFASARGDQHAGGVETALVEFNNPQLLDLDWWPARIDEIAAREMSFEKAVELTPDLAEFTRQVNSHNFNGVVGKILNYHQLDAPDLFRRMLEVARTDITRLLEDGPLAEQDAGKKLW